MNALLYRLVSASLVCVLRDELHAGRAAVQRVRACPARAGEDRSMVGAVAAGIAIVVCRGAAVALVDMDIVR